MTSAGKLSPVMEHVVRLVAVGLSPYSGSLGSERLGRGGSVRSLVRLGVFELDGSDHYVLTHRGQQLAHSLVLRGAPYDPR